LSDIETGKGNPTMETLLKVLQVLGLQILLKPTAPGAFRNAAEESKES
jgi:hypothetical protein